MRLIDADALKTALEKCAFMAAGTASLMQADTVLATLDEAPTICCERCVDGPDPKTESPICRTCCGSNFKVAP
jgi:hypothetical protein